MIEQKVLKQNYPCRTKDYFWYKESRLVIELLVKEGRTFQDIKKMSEENNLFNAVSSSRANEIRTILFRRIQAVDDKYLAFFSRQGTEVQKLLCAVMIMLTDRTFLEFMNDIFREKLIAEDMELSDSDIMGFLHSVQEKEKKAAQWTDVSMKKLRDNFKGILKDAGMLSDSGTVRKIFRPILSDEVREFLKEEGLISIYKILAGARE